MALGPNSGNPRNRCSYSDFRMRCRAGSYRAYSKRRGDSAARPVGGKRRGRTARPVYVSVANGTDDTRSLCQAGLPVNDTGERVAPLPSLSGEAARQAGRAKELSGAVQSAAVSCGARRLEPLQEQSRALPVITGTSALNLRAPVRCVGAAFGGFWGAFTGASKGQNEPTRRPMAGSALALKRGSTQGNYTVSGYVFFPRDNTAPSDAAGGRSRDRRHSSRPRTVSSCEPSRFQHRRNNHDSALPLPFSAGSQITALLPTKLIRGKPSGPEANPRAIPFSAAAPSRSLLFSEANLPVSANRRLVAV